MLTIAVISVDNAQAWAILGLYAAWRLMGRPRPGGFTMNFAGPVIAVSLHNHDAFDAWSSWLHELYAACCARAMTSEYMSADDYCGIHHQRPLKGLGPAILWQYS